MKGMWESYYILPALCIVFFLPEVQGNFDERCENPRIPSTTCGKGKFRDPNGECQMCPAGQFQDAVNHVCGQCKNCTKCGDGEISKDHPVLCLAYKDSTCLKVNDTTTPKPDGTATPSTSEGPFESSSPKTTNSEEILKSTTQATAGNITTPGSEYIQEEKHPYKIPFFVVLVLLVLVVIVLGGIIWWQRKKLKNGQHLAGNQLGQNGSGAGQNGSGAGQNGSGTGQNGSETEMTNMLANGHV